MRRSPRHTVAARAAQAAASRWRSRRLHTPDRNGTRRSSAGTGRGPSSGEGRGAASSLRPPTHSRRGNPSPCTRRSPSTRWGSHPRCSRRRRSPVCTCQRISDQRTPHQRKRVLHAHGHARWTCDAGNRCGQPMRTNGRARRYHHNHHRDEHSRRRSSAERALRADAVVAVSLVRAVARAAPC